MYSSSVPYIVAERGNCSWYISSFPSSLHITVSNFLWLLCVTDSNKMYIGFYVNCPYSYEILTTFGFSQQSFREVPNIEVHKIPSSQGKCDISPRQDRWTDEQTGMTRLRSAFYMDGKVPKKAYEIIVMSVDLFNLNF